MIDWMKDLESWQILMGLFGSGTAVGLFLGKIYQKIMNPEAGELQRQLKDEQAASVRTNKRLSTCSAARKTAETKVKNFDAVRDALFGDEDELWRLHPAARLDGYFERLAMSKPKIIMVANLKGGVGKTTITANLAAYFEKKLGKRVLAIDLDYQGSLSETLLKTAGLDYTGSLADDFISGEKNGADLLQVAKTLNPELPNTQLITSSYDLSRLENRMMLRWLLRETESDIRYNLREVLLHPAVQERFDVILIDGPPRLSTAAINALCASHYLVVPTVPDLVSVPAVKRFMTNIQPLYRQLNPALKLAGVVLNLTAGGTLTAREEDAKGVLKDDIAMAGMNGHIFEQHIPRLAALANVAGQDVLYLRNRLFREGIMEKFGEEVAKRVGLGSD